MAGETATRHELAPTILFNRIVDRVQSDGLHAIREVCNRGVIQSFADETAAHLFRERNTRAVRRIPRQLWRVVQRKLKLIDIAGRLDDVTILSGNRLELLKGDNAGRHSIRVNEQYRITFRWENGHAYEVRAKTFTRDPNWLGPAIPPGEILLEEYLKRLGLGQLEAAKRLGISLNRL